MTLGNKGFNPTIGDLVKIVSSGNKGISEGSIFRIANVSRDLGLYYIEGCEATPLRRQDFEVVAYMAVPAGSKGPVAHDKGNVTARQ
jgi:hypothetical protein